MLQVSEDIQRVTDDIVDLRQQQEEGGMDGAIFGAHFDELVDKRLAQRDLLLTKYQELSDEFTAQRESTLGPIEIAGTGDAVQAETEVIAEHMRTRRSMFGDMMREENAMLDRMQNERNAAARKADFERFQFARSTAMAQTKTVVSEAVALTAGVAHQNKVLFKINQVAGIANAIINTYEGVSKTLATYPWPLAGAMAALHLAAGLAQVSAISSASFGGGGGTTGGIGGGPAAPPSDLATSPAELLQPGGPTNISITIDGTGVMTREQTEELAQSLRDLINDGGEPIR
jgi:hypothetical protein